MRHINSNINTTAPPRGTQHEKCLKLAKMFGLRW